jgi:NADH-quinone oxidoreductase subunit M
MITHFLSILIWFPILSGVLIVLLDHGSHHPRFCQLLALASALLTLLLALLMYWHFDTTSALLQFNENKTWVAAFNIHYALGIDGIALTFVLLNVFANLIMVLSVWRYMESNAAIYMALILMSTGILNAIFASGDGLLFYLFWEASMIPVYLATGLWGQDGRSAATMKFFLYNLLGSFLMLVAMIYLYQKSGSFAFVDWQALHLSATQEDLVFLGFMAAFAVKMPMWPFHTWFADIHSEAPKGGSIVLALLMIKMGAYGLLRLILPLVPGVSSWLIHLMVLLALFAVIYVAIATLAQRDMRRLVAYASISHMGMVTLGVFVVILLLASNDSGFAFSNQSAAILALQGAIFQAVAHAFTSAGLFIGVSLLLARFGSAFVSDYSGIARVMPIFAVFMMLFILANVGLPGTSGFVGEFFIVLAVWKASPWTAAFAALTLVLTPAYTLWFGKRVIFGAVRHPALHHAKDIGALEVLIFLLLAVPVIWLGVYPQALLHVSEASSAHLVSTIQLKLTQGAL